MAHITSELARITLADGAGLVGLGLYLIVYTLLAVHRLSIRDPQFFALNVIAATAVLIGWGDHLHPVVTASQMLWVFLSTAGILLRFHAADRLHDNGQISENG